MSSCDKLMQTAAGVGASAVLSSHINLVFLVLALISCDLQLWMVALGGQNLLGVPLR